ncbi:MAG TPA: hypothetical protein DHL02_27225 [Achromobacter sp.]|nr:hypothetical protein [Achromobacter sp.]
MTDRELLELAANAAGHVTRSDNLNVWIVETDGSPIARWNPLADDAQALRLAVKLDMQIWRSTAGGVAGVSPSSDFWNRLNEPLGPDPYAATRRAIVRAAAEIGKTRSD